MQKKFFSILVLVEADAVISYSSILYSALQLMNIYIYFSIVCTMQSL